MQAFNVIRQVLLRSFDLAQARRCVIDSLPVPVMQFCLVPGSTGDWAAYGATFGEVPTEKQTISGYKLHLLATLDGVILDFELAPANIWDLEAGFDLLVEHRDLEVAGDKAYISAEKAEQLWQQNHIGLRTLPRRNQKQQLSKRAEHALNSIRQIIEPVNEQLTEQLTIDQNHAYTFWGLCTRLYSKLTAHTLCICINRLLGSPEPLQIKGLAFPNQQ